MQITVTITEPTMNKSYDIQVDNNYKRIHNYASSEEMYKNMFMSFLIGDFLLLLLYAYQVIVYGFVEWYMCVELGVVFAAIFLFYSRWEN